MAKSKKSPISGPRDLSLFLAGPGMRLAMWRQPNHSELWDEKRDDEVVSRARENAGQFPEFSKRLVKSIRGGQES